MLKYFLILPLFMFTSLMGAVGDVALNSEVNTLAEAFKQGTTSGQIRAGFIGSRPDGGNATDPETMATALGGQLKFETAALSGISAGAALYTSHTNNALSGDKAEGKFNEDFGNPNYDLFAEGYLNYEYNDLNIRVGRQLIDTPYADSDDIRMTPNTFEGAFATYGMGSITFNLGYLTQWQGPDADGGYEFNPLVEGSNGTALLSVVYEKDNIEASVWYYNVENIMNIYYGDAAYTFQINETISLIGAVQVGHQDEINNSLSQGTLYGAMLELDISDLSISFAYDHTEVDEGKQYFTGFGGGVGFVNMYEMTATTITISDTVSSWKANVSYDFSSVVIEGLSVAYDYGNFVAESITDGSATEQNFTLAYVPSAEWDIEAIYAIVDDEISTKINGGTDHSFNTVLVRANYNF